MEELFKWIFIYAAVGFLFVLVDTIYRIRANVTNIIRIKIIIAWLPALFSDKIYLWIWTKKTGG